MCRASVRQHWHFCRLHMVVFCCVFYQFIRPLWQLHFVSVTLIYYVITFEILLRSCIVKL